MHVQATKKQINIFGTQGVVAVKDLEAFKANIFSRIGAG